MTKSILRYFIVILIVALLSSCTISAMLVSNSILDTTEHDMLYSLKLIDYAFTLNEINLTAAAVTFLVYVYPIILFFVVLYISSALVPDKETRSEVLP